MKQTIELNGKTYEILEVIGEKKLTGWERAKVGENYNCKSVCIIKSIEEGCDYDTSEYEACNYTTSKKLFDRIERSQKIDLQLARYSALHGGDGIDWDNNDQEKHFIFINYRAGLKIDIAYTYNHKRLGETCFISKEIAQAAIKEIGEENILWRLTEGI